MAGGQDAAGGGGTKGLTIHLLSTWTLTIVKPMRLIVLHMLATNSLSAFSGASTTAPLARPGPVRLVRSPAGDGPPPAPPDLPPPPLNVQPGLRPRGSLLNLSV